MRYARVLTVATAAFLVVSCGLGLATELVAPTGVSATTDLEEQIELTWSSVDGASRYYVYRSTESTPPLGEDGPFGLIPYANTTATEFVDTTADSARFFYQVSAFQDFTGAESPLSAVVEGTSLAAPKEWLDPALATTGGVSAARIAVNRDSGAAYLLTVGDTVDAQAQVHTIAADGNLTTLGEEFGLVDGTVPGGVADIFATTSGIFVVLAAQTSGAVELYEYAFVADAFELVGTLGTADVARPVLTAATRGQDDNWVFYQTTTAYVAVNFDDEPGDPAPAPQSLLTRGANTVALAASDANDDLVGLMLEVENASNNTVGVELRSTATGTMGAAVDVSAGADVHALDVAIDNETGEITTVLATTAELFLNDASGTLDLALSALLPGTPALTGDSATQALALDSRANQARLLYLETDAVPDAILVAASDDDGSTWSTLSPSDLTTTGTVVPADLESFGTDLFVTYTVGTPTFVRTFQ